MRRKSWLVVAAVLVLVVAAVAAGVWMLLPHREPDPPPDPRMACHVGAYRLDDGRVVAVSPLSDGGLRWRLLDGRTGKLVQDDAEKWSGTTGWTDRPDPIAVTLGTCSRPAMAFDGHAGRRLEFNVVETRFRGNGETLAGTLVLPRGNGPFPIAVMVHGSEGYSARRFYYYQSLFPAHGVGVLVYDKRGSGDSTGTYTQDFHLLADDAVAALKEARRLAGSRAGRIGFLGASQGGWVAPLAAKHGDPDFVAVTYGLADTPLAEDRDQVQLDLEAAGYGPDVLAKAREVTDATGAIMASGFKDGYDRLDALKEKYGDEPWWNAMEGEFTGDLARYPEFALRVFGPLHDEGTSWDYEPMPVLRSQRVPLLWILAGADREAPPVETRRRLLGVAHDNPDVTVIEFPETDHGIVKFETTPDGERVETRVADGYYRLLIDWIRNGGLTDGPYGDAKRLAPANPSSQVGAARRGRGPGVLHRDRLAQLRPRRRHGPVGFEVAFEHATQVAAVDLRGDAVQQRQRVIAQHAAARYHRPGDAFGDRGRRFEDAQRLPGT